VNGSGLTPLTPGADPGEAFGAIAPLKPKKVISLTMILYNWENNIRHIQPFCRALSFVTAVL